MRVKEKDGFGVLGWWPNGRGAYFLHPYVRIQDSTGCLKPGRQPTQKGETELAGILI